MVIDVDLAPHLAVEVWVIQLRQLDLLVGAVDVVPALIKTSSFPQDAGVDEAMVVSVRGKVVGDKQVVSGGARLIEVDDGRVLSELCQASGLVVLPVLEPLWDVAVGGPLMFPFEDEVATVIKETVDDLIAVCISLGLGDLGHELRQVFNLEVFEVAVRSFVLTDVTRDRAVDDVGILDLRLVEPLIEPLVPFVQAHGLDRRRVDDRRRVVGVRAGHAAEDGGENDVENKVSHDTILPDCPHIQSREPPKVNCGNIYM